MLKKVSITGPESTGKSLLAEGLAKHYNTSYVPEYAREHLKDIGRNYTLEDINIIAKGQLLWEAQFEMATDKALLFCDTDLLVTKIWAEVVFGQCPEWIEQMFVEHQYDLYLLCYPDLEWQPDPLRENPDDREYLFRLYEQELKEQKFPYAVVKGEGDQRLKNAVNFADRIL